MKNKGLMVAIAVLAVLGGLMYWSDKKKAEEEKHPTVAADAPPKILTIPEDQIQGIRVEKRGGDIVAMSKASGKWELTDPKPLPADQDAANGVVQNLSSLSSDRLIEEKAGKLDAYGLTSPAEKVIVTQKNGKVDALLIGDDSPTGSGVYAKLANDPRVFTIATFVKTGLDKSAKDLRDKRLLHFNTDKLTRVEVTAKGAPFEFGKNGQNEWQVVKPSAMRADGQQVDELVRKLKEAKMDPNVSEEDTVKAQKAFAAGTKVGTVTTADSSGTETLEIRKDKDKTYYAKSSAVDGIYKMPADFGDGIDKAVDDFRNKKLFDFGFTDPTQVAVGAQVFQKSGEKWMSGGGQMDSASVQNVIDKLRDLAATGFAAKAAGEQFVALSATANNKAERVSVTKQGSDYFATREGEPAVYQLDAKAVDDIQKAAGAVKPFAAPKATPKK